MMNRLTSAAAMVLLLYSAAAVSAQEPVTATATDRDCERAYVQAVTDLLRRHGARAVQTRSVEQTRIEQGGDKTKLSVETQTTLGALFRTPFVSYRRSSQGCVADIAISEEELARAQEDWLERVDSGDRQLILARLQQIQSSIEANARRSQAAVGPMMPRERLRMWPFALGMVAASAGATAMAVQEYQLHEAINRGAPRSELERIIAERDMWRKPTMISAGAAFGYLLVRAAVGPSSAARTPRVIVGVEPRRLSVVWHSNFD